MAWPDDPHPDGAAGVGQGPDNLHVEPATEPPRDAVYPRRPQVLDTLDAPAVRTWCRLSLAALGQAREEIDALNVFPVPDGDTGTNLYLTVESAAEEVDRLFGAETPTLAEAMRAMAHGALLGARGNSGVILAQLLRGAAPGTGRGRRRGRCRRRRRCRAAAARG
jgi:hypothetical protein